MTVIFCFVAGHICSHFASCHQSHTIEIILFDGFAFCINTESNKRQHGIVNKQFMKTYSH